MGLFAETWYLVTLGIAVVVMLGSLWCLRHWTPRRYWPFHLIYGLVTFLACDLRWCAQSRRHRLWDKAQTLDEREYVKMIQKEQRLFECGGRCY